VFDDGVETGNITASGENADSAGSHGYSTIVSHGPVRSRQFLISRSAGLRDSACDVPPLRHRG
jgi:hypothetical protein